MAAKIEKVLPYTIPGPLTTIIFAMAQQMNTINTADSKTTEIDTLNARLAILNGEIARISTVMNQTAFIHDTGDDDDNLGESYMSDEGSAINQHLNDLLEELNEFSADREKCERQLRSLGVTVAARDDY